jgi:ankyrin repeat protein
MFASMKGDVQLIHTILKHNPNVNMKDINNRNALFYVIDSGKGDNADVVISLIKAGINVNEVEKQRGHTPLSLATVKNLKNTVKAILDNKGDPNHVVEPSGNTPLHYAVQNSNLEIVKLLIAAGANINVINNDNTTPISMALNLASTDIYKVLVEEINRQNIKANEIAQDLMSETTPTKKKKKNEIVDNVNKEETNEANIEEIKKHINYSCVNKKKKPTKIEFIEFIKEKNNKKKQNSSYNLEIPFTFNKNAEAGSLNSFIST